MDAVALNRRRVIITMSLQQQCKGLGAFSLGNIAARPLRIGHPLVGDRWQRVAQDFERDRIELDGHHWF